MPAQERMSLVVSWVLIGLSLYLIIDLPTQTISLQLFGTLIILTISQRIFMACLLAVLTLTGTRLVIRTQPEQHYISYALPFWINPTLLVALATLILALVGRPLIWTLGLILTGIMLWTTIAVEVSLLITNSRSSSFNQLWSQWVSYALLFGYALIIYQSQLSRLLSTICLAGLAALLSLSALKLNIARHQRVGGMSLVIAWITGQISWILQSLGMLALSAGLITGLIFYALCGLVDTHLQNKVSPQIVAEYGVVVILGSWLVFQFVG